MRWSRSLGNGPGPDRVLGALPAVPLAALFGRPAWGLVGMEYGEARGTSAFSESAFSLVTVVVEGDRLAVAAAASLGEDVWGGEGGGRSDVTCPRMRTESLALVESCPEWASGAPRLFHAGPFPYEERCAPECTAGRAVRTVLVPRGETLVPRDAVPVRAIGELDPEALSVLERRSSAVRLRLVGSAADLRGMVVRVGDQLGVVEAPCPIAPSRPVWLAGGDGDPMAAGTCWVGDLALDGPVDLLRPDGVALEHLDPL